MNDLSVQEPYCDPVYAGNCGCVPLRDLACVWKALACCGSLPAPFLVCLFPLSLLRPLTLSVSLPSGLQLLSATTTTSTPRPHPVRAVPRYHPAVVSMFMISFVLLTALTMIKLVVAVVLDNFEEEVDKDLEREVGVQPISR